MQAERMPVIPATQEIEKNPKIESRVVSLETPASK